MKNISLLIAWVATLGLAAALIHEKSKPEKTKEVLKEVVREVPKEVVREVEVIREVPKEVIREVEVIKEVERALTDLETFHMAVGKKFLTAEVKTEPEDILKGISSVRVVAAGNPDAVAILSEREMRDTLELALRTNGIKIDPKSRFEAGVFIDLMWNKEKTTATLTVKGGISTQVSFLAAGSEIRDVRANIFEEGRFGSVGATLAKNTLHDLIDKFGKEIALNLLRAQD